MLGAGAAPPSLLVDLKYPINQNICLAIGLFQALQLCITNGSYCTAAKASHNDCNSPQLSTPNMSSARRFLIHLKNPG